MEKIGNEDIFYTLKHDGLKDKIEEYIDNLLTAVSSMLDAIVKNKYC